MNKCLGIRIAHGTINYFITSPEQALPQHAAAAKRAFNHAVKSTRSVLFTDPSQNLTITACRTYAEIAKWVVLEDVDPKEFNHGIFTTMWVPETPVPMECDHLGRKRFKVLDFAENAAEANSIVNALRKLNQGK